MNEEAVPAATPVSHATAGVELGARGWLREGLRAGFLLPPRVRGARVRPIELALVAAIAIGTELLLGRLEVDGEARFNLRGWLAPWWALAAMVVLLWALLWSPSREPREHGGVAAWLTLWLVAALPAGVLSQLLGAASARELLPAQLVQSSAFAWGVYLLLWLWTMAAALMLGRRFGLTPPRLVALGAGLALIFGVTAWQFPERPWEAPVAATLAEEPQPLVLTQESFEIQQTIMGRAVEALAPQRPGVTDVYGIVFAPYAAEDVFLKESALVADLLAQRFDARGRVLQLVNHVATAESLPWATPRNLKRAIDAIAARMDREHDLLVLYLTSHGAQDFQLAATHPPLQVDTVSPGELRVALDEAGIRHRVIAVSACFSGGWVGPLGGDSTLVMTAADADHTSYGCGKLSDLTFFGRAVFGEQLRRTRSFEEAFAAAVPVIRQREQEAGKPDGFSNPQISVGERIRPLLADLQQRLDAVPPVRP